MEKKLIEQTNTSIPKKWTRQSVQSRIREKHGRTGCLLAEEGKEEGFEV